jgi:catechol 2,3-dioxygenase-like lactoylglutathione lyase family enzyme
MLVSYAALVTNAFDAVVHFYGETLGFPVVEEWDRPNGRGRRFDLGGLRLEILDNAREREPLSVGAANDRFQIVIEVQDIVQTRSRLAGDFPQPVAVSWGARLFHIRDPDGVPVTFLQWDQSRGDAV